MHPRRKITLRPTRAQTRRRRGISLRLYHDQVSMTNAERRKPSTEPARKRNMVIVDGEVS
jgi:hypothetical protein